LQIANFKFRILFFDHFDAFDWAYLGTDTTALAVVIIKSDHLLPGYEN